MKTRKGFIVKSKTESGQTVFNHLTSNELHLVSKICKDSSGGIVEIKETTFTDNINFSDLINQKF